MNPATQAMFSEAWNSKSMAGGAIRSVGRLDPRWYRGMGIKGLGSQTTQTAEGIALQGAAGTASILTAAFPAAMAGPVGIAVAGILVAASLIMKAFKGCGQTCIQATQIANQVGDALKQNVQAYIASPIRTRSMQAAALNNFDTTWAALVQACSNPQLQAAGQRCISDRQQGSCKWKASAGGWSQSSSGTWTYTAPGPAGSGDVCWNYFVGFRDPIANDPGVVDDSVAAAQALGVSTGGAASASISGLLSSPAVWIGAGILGLLWATSD